MSIIGILEVPKGKINTTPIHVTFKIAYYFVNNFFLIFGFLRNYTMLLNRNLEYEFSQILHESILQRI